MSRAHPLLFSAYTCGPYGGALCLACRRWHRHYITVMQRVRAWRAAQ